MTGLFGREVEHRASERRGLVVSEQRRFRTPGAWVLWQTPPEYCSPRPTWHPMAMLDVRPRRVVQ